MNEDMCFTGQGILNEFIAGQRTLNAYIREQRTLNRHMELLLLSFTIQI